MQRRRHLRHRRLGVHANPLDATRGGLLDGVGNPLVDLGGDGGGAIGSHGDVEGAEWVQAAAPLTSEERGVDEAVEGQRRVVESGGATWQGK